MHRNLFFFRFGAFDGGDETATTNTVTVDRNWSAKNFCHHQTAANPHDNRRRLFTFKSSSFPIYFYGFIGSQLKLQIMTTQVSFYSILREVARIIIEQKFFDFLSFFERKVFLCENFHAN